MLIVQYYGIIAEIAAWKKKKDMYKNLIVTASNIVWVKYTYLRFIFLLAKRPVCNVECILM